MGVTPARDADLPAYAKTLIRIKARKLVRRPGCSQSDIEDMAQELALYVVKQLKGHDLDRGSITTYLRLLVDTAAHMIVRDSGRIKRGGGLSVGSLDVPCKQDDDDGRCPRDLLTTADLGRRLGRDSGYDDDVETAAAVAEAIGTLPPELQEIARCLQEKPEATVAKEMGRSRRWMREATERIRKQFEDAGLGNS